MSAAARKITEAARELNDSVTEGVRRVIVELESFADADPRVAFGSTVRDHREAVKALDETLATMAELSGVWMRDAEPHLELNRHLQRALRAACFKLRVCRTLSAHLLGDKAAISGETPDVTDEVNRILTERGAANFNALDPEERRLLGVVHQDSEIEAWLQH